MILNYPVPCRHKQASIVFAGRSESSFARATKEMGQGRAGVSYRLADVDDGASVAAAIDGADIVVHTAGPFQQRRENNVLKVVTDRSHTESTLSNRVPQQQGSHT